ncbi:MAG: HD domain-containing protein [Acidimicrobiaceae bacterium]|nr:HD domain-containing protein [Acidimicrobiaceae bacterium]
MSHFLNENSFEDEKGQLQSLFARKGVLDGIATGILLFGPNSEIIDCNRAGANLLGATKRELIGFLANDLIWDAVYEDGLPFPAEERPVMVTLRTGKPCYSVVVGVDNAGKARRWLSNTTFPLIVEGQVTGVLSSLTDVTDRVKKEKLLNLLNEVTRVVMFATDESDSLRQICLALVKQGNYALAWIGVPDDDEEGSVKVVCSAGDTDYLHEGMVSWLESRERGRGPVGIAFRTRSTQVENDLAGQSRNNPWRERAAQFGLASLIAVPFPAAGAKAVLVIYDRHIHAFDESTVDELEKIADGAKFGVDHIRSVNQLQSALDGTLAALAGMTETRDPYTAGHQVSVGSMAEAIAMRLGLASDFVKTIRQSGEVHDIGKISIPAEILTRPGRLGFLESEIIKGHPRAGYDILSKASLPWPIADVALQHHERMDGSGYPDGLSGNEICLPARIIAVADVFEAMTQHRPYRPALGSDRALSEISAGSGTLYDPQVVAAFMAVMESADRPAKPL